MPIEQPQTTAAELLAADWFCDEKVNFPADDGTVHYLVFAWGEKPDGSPDGPLQVCECADLEAARAVVEAHDGWRKWQALVMAPSIASR